MLDIVKTVSIISKWAKAHKLARVKKFLKSPDTTSLTGEVLGKASVQEPKNDVYALYHFLFSAYQLHKCRSYFVCLSGQKFRYYFALSAGAVEYADCTSAEG